MHEYARKCIARKFTPFSQGKSCFRRSSDPKTVNGDAIYCVAVALPAQPENRFSARSGIGFVDGRQSRYGKSPDDSPHDSPAIRIVN
jgi:hypothetical protein